MPFLIYMNVGCGANIYKQEQNDYISDFVWTTNSAVLLSKHLICRNQPLQTPMLCLPVEKAYLVTIMPPT